MIIPKEEVEKATKNFSNSGVWQCPISFKAGIEFSEEYVQKHVQDIIIENQGLKLYKDNKAERFRKLAIEFAEWISWCGWTKLLITDSQNWSHITGDVKTTKELFEIFKKEKYEHEH